MPDVVVPTPRGKMPCYLAVPPAPGPLPGVIVLHDVGGMSQDHRNQADWLAEAGFLALAVDLYYLAGFLRCIRAVARDLMDRTGPTFEDVEASAPGSSPSRTAPAGSASSVSAWEAASFFSLFPAMASQPRASTTAADSLLTSMIFSRHPVPLLAATVLRAAGNKAPPMSLSERFSALIPHDVKEYPDAGHSFMNNKQQWWFKLLRFRGIAYNETAAMDARRRISAFFHTHLG